MARQSRCRICKKRPPWRYKNCPPGICKKCYHAHVWPDRPAARAERQAASTLGQDTADDGWIESIIELSDDPAADSSNAEQSEPQLPPWPIRRVTAGMKRCGIPGANEFAVFFGDLLSDDPDQWAETDVDVTGAIQDALDGVPALFLVVESDGLTPHYGRVTVTRGCARLLLWEGGGSVCDETISATRADVVLAEARERAQRLLAAYPTQPDAEAELAELSGTMADPGSPDPARRCKKHRSSSNAPRHCSACQAKREQVAATAKRLRARAVRSINARLAAVAEPADHRPEG